MSTAIASTFTFSTTSITMDSDSVDITISCANKSYSHKLRHAFGTIVTLTAGKTSYTWHPTAEQLIDFWEEVPSQKTRQVNVILDTYNGSTLVGTATRTLNITLSEATGKPVYTDYTFKDANIVAKNIGIWVYGKSKSSSTRLNGTTKYGSKFSEHAWYAKRPFSNPYVYNILEDALNWAAGAVKEPTAITLASKIKDTRGFWSDEVTNEYYVASYKAPHLDVFEVLRCDASGAEDDLGSKAKVKIKGSWTAMKVETVYKNTATLKVGYRVKGSTDAYTFQPISISGGTLDISQLLTATLAADSDYEFSVIFSDKFEETDARSEIGFTNVGNIIYVSPDGKHVELGSNNGCNMSIDEEVINIRDRLIGIASLSKNSIDITAPICRSGNSSGIWISGINDSNCTIVGKSEPNTGQYLPFSKASTLDYYWNIGSINNSVGIYAFKKDRTANGTDYKFEFNVASGGANINGIPLITQTKWLWNGTSNPRYMSAEHKVTLSENVKSQPNGIILCWCGYSGGKRQDYNFSYTFVPKMHVEQHSGCGLWCLVCDSQKGGWNGSVITSGMTAKYVYVNNNTITGHAGNHNSDVTNDVVNKTVLFGVLAV